MKIVPVILCGGVGTRLWPLSRSTYPKQFLKIFSDKKSLFAQTLKRINNDIFDDPIIVCNKDYEFKVRQELLEQGINAKAIILEPVGRNTAPAIALASLYMRNSSLENQMLVLPADHFIEDFSNFRDLLTKIVNSASDKIVTFGITPLSPSTAYGYIKYSENGKDHILKVENFVEKPNKGKAEEYLIAGNFLWNSGIFLFDANTYINELVLLKSDIFNAVNKSLIDADKINNVILPASKEFLNSEDISIDYAILEKSKKVFVAPINIKWSDVGSWDSISKVSNKNADGNTIIGDVLSLDSKDNFVYSQDNLTALVDVKDLIIISTKDAVLVSSKKNSEKVKNIVQKLQSLKRKESLEHLRIYRPWGYYEDIDYGDKFRAKRIVVEPNKKLSLQLHNHRSEHWVVVKGVASITIDNKRFELVQGESTFVPKKTKHRLENNTAEILEIIEVQIGDYLGEDDIVRFNDVYGRATGGI